VSAAEDLKQTEQQQVAKLEQAEQELVRQAQAFAAEHQNRMNAITALYRDLAIMGMPNVPAITAAESQALTLLEGWCRKYAEWQTYFAGFENVARYLGNAGLPRLSLQLAEIQADSEGARQTYLQMCGQMIQHRQKILGIQQDAVTHIGNTIRSVVDNQRAVFENFQARWRAETFNLCPICGSLLQSRSLPYCWNCKHVVVRF
jgi:hypothetical protein